ncbi:MAG: hypothetical protein HYT93_01355 [Parcubacteria group bacterium]|nr:hypothetical protein [Parcubacteria group bacterium]
MRYSLKQIFDTRYDPNRPVARRLAERFVPINIITKALSPYSAFIFLNLGISADVVTFLSLVAIITSAILFILGYAIAGIIGIFIFGVLDSTDGDVARVHGRTTYGGALDALGADFFYTFIPSSIGYLLFSKGVTVGPLSPEIIFIAAISASLFFLLYRTINIKRINFLMGHHRGDDMETASFVRKEAGRSMSVFFHMAKLYRHVLIKDNFFSEPGLILWFSIFVLFGKWEFLAGYLLLILLYNFGFLVSNFIKMYITFLRVEKERM